VGALQTPSVLCAGASRLLRRSRCLWRDAVASAASWPRLSNSALSFRCSARKLAGLAEMPPLVVQADGPNALVLISKSNAWPTAPRRGRELWSPASPSLIRVVPVDSSISICALIRDSRPWSRANCHTRDGTSQKRSPPLIRDLSHAESVVSPAMENQSSSAVRSDIGKRRIGVDITGAPAGQRHPPTKLGRYQSSDEALRRPPGSLSPIDVGRRHFSDRDAEAETRVERCTHCQTLQRPHSGLGPAVTTIVSASSGLQAIAFAAADHHVRIFASTNRRGGT